MWFLLLPAHLKTNMFVILGGLGYFLLAFLAFRASRVVDARVNKNLLFFYFSLLFTIIGTTRLLAHFGVIDVATNREINSHAIWVLILVLLFDYFKGLKYK